MLRPIDNYFLQLDEPLKSYMLAMRQHILAYDADMSERWHYGMPFFYYKQKRCLYLWTHKKYHKPYLGIVDGKYINGPELLSEERKRMKILLLDPEQDIPVKKIDSIIEAVLRLYRD